MTPTDFVAICALGLLIFGGSCFVVLLAWMLWESLIEPIWLLAVYRWRAWRGRDPDDQWHA